MNKKKKKIVFITGLLIFFLLLIFPVYIYLENVTIFEPFTINISEITPQEAKSIGIYGITPLGKKINIYYDETLNRWGKCYNSIILKNINILIPDSLKYKISHIYVDVENNQFSITIKDLHAANLSVNKNEYTLPAYIRSKSTIIKMIPLLLQIPLVYVIWKIIQTFVLLLLILLIFRLIKKNKVIRKFLLFIITKLKNYGIISPQIIIWAKIFSFSIIFACSLYFGYVLMKYTVASYVTAVLFILFSGMVIWLILQIIFKIFKPKISLIKKTNNFLIIFLLFWLYSESTLRIFGINKSYNEKISSYYASGYNKASGNSHLWIHSRYENVVYKRKEFDYKIQCNADGLRDIDHPIEKEKNEYRIICIGNSFTEGMGTPQDSTWCKLFENMIKTEVKRKISVFNAGVTGSDPFFEYMLLKEKMLRYKPDLVTVALGASDLNFFRFRGGFERFTPEGFHYRKGPEWEKLYAVSYIVRFISNSILNYLYFLSPANYQAETKNELNAIKDCVYRFYKLSAENHFKLAVIFYDDNCDLYAPLKKELKNENIIPVIDLYEYNKNIEKLIGRSHDALYWSIDEHCKSKGYYLFAKGVEWNLNKIGLIDSIRNSN